MRIVLKVWIKSSSYRGTRLLILPGCQWHFHPLDARGATDYLTTCTQHWSSAVAVSYDYNCRRVLVRKEMFGTLQQRQPTANFSAGGYGLSKHRVQHFLGWFLSFLGHNKSPSKPVKRHSADSVLNDFLCLVSFWCSQHQCRVGGNKTWSCWNPALPRPVCQACDLVLKACAAVQTITIQGLLGTCARI